MSAQNEVKSASNKNEVMSAQQKKYKILFYSMSAPLKIIIIKYKVGSAKYGGEISINTLSKFSFWLWKFRRSSVIFTEAAATSLRRIFGYCSSYSRQEFFF